MMGQQSGSQDSLFYSFNLDGHVPRSHVPRGIDRFFDLCELRAHLAPFCGSQVRVLPLQPKISNSNLGMVECRPQGRRFALCMATELLAKSTACAITAGDRSPSRAGVRSRDSRHGRARP
jgi:hypothetical protein